MTRFPEEREQVMAICLENLIQGEWSLDEAVTLFPEWEDDIEGLMPLVRTFHQAQVIRPRPSFTTASRERLERRMNLRTEPPPTGLRRLPFLRFLRRQRRRLGLAMEPTSGALWPYALLAGLLLLLLFTVTGIGVVRAADGAAPGDMLFPLDRMLEQRKLAQLSDPTVATLQQLQNAEERLEEIQALSARGDGDQIPLALAEYGEIVGSLVGSSGERDEALTQVVNQTLAAQGAQLDRLLVPSEYAAAARGATVGCAEESEVHRQLAAQALGRLYGLGEEEIGAWRCAGHNFGEIVVALETTRRLAIPVPELLARRQASAGWGQVWRVLNGQEASPPEQRPAAARRSDPPGQQKEPPGQQNVPPGQQKEPPGQQNVPPGQEKEPPGQQNVPPGQEKEPPGQQNNPPGQQNVPPGQQNAPPGQENKPEKPDKSGKPDK